MEKDINKTDGIDEPDLSNKSIIDLLKRLENQQETIKNDRRTILEYLIKLEKSLNSNSILKEELNLDIFVLLFIESAVDTIKEHRSLIEYIIYLRLEYNLLRMELSKKFPHNETKEFLIKKIKNRIQNLRCMFIAVITKQELLKEKMLLRSFGITHKKKLFHKLRKKINLEVYKYE